MREPSMTPADVGGRIRALMRERGVTAITLAQAAECGISTIYAYLGGRFYPGLYATCHIAQALGTTVEYLAFGDERMKEKKCE